MSRRRMANRIVMRAPPAGEADRLSVCAMVPVVRTGSLSGAVAWLAFSAAVFGAGPVASQPQAQAVTSDTPEYCLRLLNRVSEMVRVAAVPPPQEVTFLSSEGQRMCDQGQ